MPSATIFIVCWAFAEKWHQARTLRPTVVPRLPALGQGARQVETAEDALRDENLTQAATLLVLYLEGVVELIPGDEPEVDEDVTERAAVLPGLRLRLRLSDCGHPSVSAPTASGYSDTSETEQRPTLLTCELLRYIVIDTKKGNT